MLFCDSDTSVNLLTIKICERVTT